MTDALRDRFPAFTYRGETLGYAGLRYQPHPDIIFPSVVRTDLLRDPRGRYYLYYAPHNAPGGICLAWADAPDGPWTEHPDNPLIRRDWPPHYAVSHVSSPHALWNPEEGRLFLYFHGENSTTRFAVSEDGVHFAYGGVAVTTAMLGDGFKEASYARVFRHPVPGTASRYAMIVMGNDHGTRNLYLGLSPDGRDWALRREPLVTPPPGTSQTGPGWLTRWRGQGYLLVFANLASSPEYDPVSDLHLYAVDEELTRAEHLGPLLDHAVAGEDNLRLSDPCLLEEADRWYLYLNVGRRLNQRIGLAVADPR